jgi:hypothetical protein
MKTAALLTAAIAVFSGLAAQTPNPASATTACTAGTVTTAEIGTNVRVVTFRAPNSGNGTCTWEVPANVFVVDYLVVAGGGGGASGGGGGGGVVTTWDQASANPMTVEPGAEIDVTVGAGGDGGAGGADRYSAGATNTALHRDAPQSGNNSVFGSVVAIGGGAGGHRRLDVTDIAKVGAAFESARKAGKYATSNIDGIMLSALDSKEERALNAIIKKEGNNA